MKKEEILKKLQAPFEVNGADGKIYPDLKWKVQSTKGDEAVCVPYITARQVSMRLNKVLGMNWSDTYIEMNREALICEITINVEGESIGRSGIGVPSDYAKEKGMASDSFKRAAVKFGIGAYIAEMEPVNLEKIRKGDKIYASINGKALVSGAELSSYINQKHPLRAKLSEIYNSITNNKDSKIQKLFTELWKLLTKQTEKK